MKTNRTCPDYLKIPLDDPSMLEAYGTPYGEPLATVNVPIQPENSPMFSILEGFAQGTVFTALAMPYTCPTCLTDACTTCDTCRPAPAPVTRPCPCRGTKNGGDCRG